MIMPIHQSFQISNFSQIRRMKQTYSGIAIVGNNIEDGCTNGLRFLDRSLVIVALENWCLEIPDHIDGHCGVLACVAWVTQVIHTNSQLSKQKIQCSNINL